MMFLRKKKQGKRNEQGGFTPTPIAPKTSKMSAPACASTADRRSASAQLVSGFTLVEMIVAVGIFLIILSIGGSAIVTVYDTNRRVRTLQPVMDNFSVIVEDMVRTIRTGTDYDCNTPSGGDCTNGTRLYIDSAQQETVVYNFNTTDPSDPFIEKTWTSPANGQTYNALRMTQDAITVEDLAFHVQGTGSNEKPYVVLHIKGYIEKKGEKVDFNTQTTVTQR